MGKYISCQMMIFKGILRNSNNFLTIKNNYDYKLFSLAGTHHIIEKKEQN